jgi:hypothetical protein
VSPPPSQVWRQQNSQRWHDNPLIAQDCYMLSRECIDLLNRMFDLNEASRCAAKVFACVVWGAARARALAPCTC